MKGAFITAIDIYKEKYKNTGIGKKITTQLQTFEKAGFQMDCFVVHPLFTRSIINSIITRLPLFPAGKNWNTSLDAQKYDFVYIRRETIDFSLYLLVKAIKKKSFKTSIIFELPTYPYDKEIYGRFVLPIILKDHFWRCFLHNYVDRLITFSEDSSIFGIPTIITSNGVEERSYVEKKEVINNNQTINLIAVAQLMPWHGYDRMIKGISDYYRRGGKREICFHVVGDGPEYNKLSKMVSQFRIEKKVKLYGRKTGNELLELYAFGDIGVDSLGRHRNGIYYNSTLKGKEYLSVGLPIISGVKTELDYIKDYKYYYRVEASESAIDMEEIINFYDAIYGDKTINEINDIRKKINAFCNERFTHEKVWKPIIDYIVDCKIMQSKK